MTQKQIDLVENSWDFVLLNTQEAGIIFYEKLFQLNPDLRPLFKEGIKAQSQKLVALITFVVHKLDNLSEIMGDVRALGERHKNYKVEPEHYASVASALLWTLEKSLGDRWNEETKEAWIAIYTILSRTMIEATQDKSVL